MVRVLVSGVGGLHPLTKVWGWPVPLTQHRWTTLNGHPEAKKSVMKDNSNANASSLHRGEETDMSGQEQSNHGRFANGAHTHFHANGHPQRLFKWANTLKLWAVNPIHALGSAPINC